ncbi:hypothetical protein [Brenneria tiliae]|uniref:DUF2684 domain-containing protein n=1 Tax=Brenneria tiliae TaxID=2914984 RepID=A0ABT0MWI1_9GAMM|nr:hypothetical protein [Brenneria tiliae]MCL2894211.1 hypothetical protein [Brenneria tiliae]MCL2898802.1 hypothetical protein [Brenneria tiliae]MCL2903261.1 hypothetical protein [Brenneria tiliae]
MSFFTFKSKPLSSVSVNRYRWINIWMAILGHILALLPAVFSFSRPSPSSFRLLEVGRRDIFILLFRRHPGINGERFVGRDVIY